MEVNKRASIGLVAVLAIILVAAAAMALPAEHVKTSTKKIVAIGERRETGGLDAGVRAESGERLANCVTTEKKKWIFFGVYDGHGGKKAIELVTCNLHFKILEMLENCHEDKANEEAKCLFIHKNIRS
ncbi:Protein-serine/threonine phosphatase [Forsythia ovata]|uniref:Protein-serine/threonine phosphatase n=1 Tax=Forsythia ovata TaxID=205694 RepID=A0ABD1TRL0_9LAMI